MEKPKLKPEHMLMEAIGFTEDDLEANREGYLSARQQAQLRAVERFWIMIAIIGLIGPLVVGSALDLSSAWILVVGCGIPFYAFLKWLRLHHFLRSGNVNSAEGRVNLRIRGRKYLLEMPEIHLEAKSKVFLAFKNRDPYCIYYLPGPDDILSAEWLREE